MIFVMNFLYFCKKKRKMGISLKRPNSKLSRATYLFAATYGLFAVVAMALCLFILHQSGYRTDTVHPWVLDIVLLGVMIYAVISYKRNPISEHKINTRQAYVFCVVLGVVCAIAYFFFAAFYINIVRPELPAEYIQYQSTLINAAEITEAAKVADLQILAQVSPWSLAFTVFQELILISALAPLVLSVFLRTER